MADEQLHTIDESLDILLDRYSIDEDRYSIGPFFSDGVTIYKQQVRALNLIYALAERKHIHYGLGKHNERGPDPKAIGIIGGGVAGMTAAVAAATLGNDVWHFEQRTDLCHLQSGCETRWVHPHNYDWPKHGSANPYAGLFLMNWQAGTAAEVARALTRQYDAKEKDTGKLRLHLGATTFLKQKTIKWDNCVSKNVSRTGSVPCDLVILAMGFGIERYVRRGDVASYWRNDDLNQLRPGVTSERREAILVSGTGDGGLVDMLRSKIFGFNQAWIIDDLFTEEEEALLDFLRDLTKSSRRSLFTELSNCLKRTESVEAKALERVLGRLRPKIRKDVTVILNGRGQTFADAIHPRKAALLNCVLAYLLHIEGEFTYAQGDVGGFEASSVILQNPPRPDERAGTAPKGEGQAEAIETKYSVDRVIVRHGTEREESLRLLGLDQGSIVGMKQRQQGGGLDKSHQPYWTAGWWSLQPDTDQQMAKGIKEFLPPASEALAATFIQTLGEMIFQETRGEQSDAEFRLTVHRVVDIRGKQYFQQMAPYAARGERERGDEVGESGRIWGLEVGIVGLVFRTGLPVVLIKKASGEPDSDEAWEKLWAALETDPTQFVRTKPGDVVTLAAIPIFSRSNHADATSRTVSLVVFADSKDPSLFAHSVDRPTSAALTEIFRAARGFVRSCDYLVQKNVVRLPDHPLTGVKAPSVEVARQELEVFGPQARDGSQLIEGYSEEFITSQNCLHWDCIYVSNQFLHGRDAPFATNIATDADRPESPP